MLNRILKSSLANRVAVLVLSAVIMMAGIWSLSRMEVDIFPDLTAPTVVVMTEAAGLAPEEVERQVTYPIESAVNGVSGIRRVRSASNPGFSVVWAEFDWDTDAYLARQMITERLATVEMPAGVSAPVLGPQSSILGEMMIIGLTSPGDSVSMMELRTIADKTITPRLLSISGVAAVAVLGGDAKEMQIALDPMKMQAYGVSLSQVADAVGAMNDNASGGVIMDFGNEYLVRADLNTSDPAEIASAPIGGGLTVGHVATVGNAAAEPKIGTASIEGSPAVIITVTKQANTGTPSLTARIDAELASIAAGLPVGVRMHTDIFRQNDFIETSISNLQRTLLEGAVFVAIVLFFFLMNLRTTLISLVALPMSILVTVLVLHLLGFTINTMSLGGIAIAIGSLVDDAIVDVENVYRRLRLNRALPKEERLPAIKVVFEASAEVRMPIFNSSLIIMASFLPLFCLSGVEGRLLIPLGVAFIIALIASTFVALTLTPVLCSYLLGSGRNEKALSAEPALSVRFKKFYRRTLTSALGRPRPILISTAVLFLFAIGVFFTLGRGFLPRFNEGSFTINIGTLPGVSLEESDKLAREAERAIMSVPEVRTVARKTGRAELDEHSLSVNASELEVPYVLTDRSRSEVEAELRHKLTELPGVNVEIGQPISHRIDAMLSGSKSQVAIKLFGPDLSVLYSLAQKIKASVSEVDGIVDLNVEQLVTRPELLIRPRRDALAAHGVSLAEFRRWISLALSGEAVSRVYDGDYPYDLTLILAHENRRSAEALRALPIDTPDGVVPLSSLADVISTTGPSAINRENVKRRIIISCNVEGRDLRGAIDDIRDEIAADITLPEGYYINYGGQFENEEEAGRILLLTSVGALLIIMLLLFGQFRSWSQTALILLNMPLALIGGILILWICGGEVNIPAVIGFISLMGISTRNGMLLISHYNSLSDLSLRERVINGSSDRLLPIVMTALTSALALVPLAVNGSEPGNEIQSPMALVILGGLISSTVLNLYVVPVVYSMINKNKQ
ncbi:MAG: CusA/CzcA family heavy metal efflux RND transporter [Muribaculaceae bacterium]|nr:CusA/CzcA family heavy metal efflux RND transporter [Muribaculaceae bacterium]